jgi:hypothetical protein
MKTRYVAVMSGSSAPVACRHRLVSQHLTRGIIRGTLQSNRAGWLHGKRERHPTSNRLADEGRPSRAGELHCQILPNQ